MSTRSYVGYEQEDGSIKHVYVHFDGYPEGVGRTLKTHWGNREDVLALLSKGGISSIGANMEETDFYGKEGESVERNGMEFPYGDGDGEIHTVKSLDELKDKVMEDWGIEYFYVYTANGKWEGYGNSGGRVAVRKET